MYDGYAAVMCVIGCKGSIKVMKCLYWETNRIIAEHKCWAKIIQSGNLSFVCQY